MISYLSLLKEFLFLLLQAMVLMLTCFKGLFRPRDTLCCMSYVMIFLELPLVTLFTYCCKIFQHRNLLEQFLDFYGDQRLF